MREFKHSVAGQECLIYYPERPADIVPFLEFVSRNPVLAMDTETTGLDIYRPDFQVRLVQFGNATEAWVLQADQFAGVISSALKRTHLLVHSPFDIRLLDWHGFASLESTIGRYSDTAILAHLIDPRGRAEGGIGLGLKDLTARHVDKGAPDTQKDLHAVFKKELKCRRQAEGWRAVPIDHPLYVTYAGLDVLYTFRLFYSDAFEALKAEKKQAELITFEHEVQGVCEKLIRRGVRIDVPYTEQLAVDLDKQFHEGQAELADVFGLENVNSPKQVADKLLSLGWRPTEFTKTGQPKTDSKLLDELALDGGETGKLATMIKDTKRPGKWRKAYALGMLDVMDPNNRVHAIIRALQARTARMSISEPALQQLPSGKTEWTIRRCIIADDGQSIGGVDYKAVEMRVLAALADEKHMKHAIMSGIDLHDYTAGILFGTTFTEDERKLAKMTGFGKVYGGGAATLRRQTGAPLDKVKEVIRAYDETYPGIKDYSRSLMNEARYNGNVIETPAGRRLPLDEERLYSATNYVVQSTARDLLCLALVRLDKSDVADNVLLPVHDEVIYQAPKAEAQGVANRIAEIMGTDFFGVPIEADPACYGASWGHGYGAPV